MYVIQSHFFKMINSSDSDFQRDFSFQQNFSTVRQTTANIEWSSKKGENDGKKKKDDFMKGRNSPFNNMRGRRKSCSSEIPSTKKTIGTSTQDLDNACPSLSTKNTN